MNRHIQPIIDDLRLQLSQAEAAARINAETIAELQKDRDLYRDMGVSIGKELLRERETIAEQQREIERLKHGEFICISCALRKDSEQDARIEF